MLYKKSRGVLDLKGKVCLVTGASRGLGKGIAVQLAYHGATCYITGRNLETLQKVNKEVEEKGGSGTCIPVPCDHEKDEEVREVFKRIDRENDGKLDLLVNNAFSAVLFVIKHFQSKFWETPPETWDIINNVGLRNHYICAMYAAKMMIPKRQGLIINISSIGGLRYLFSAPYGVGKAAKDRMAQDCAFELRKYKVAFISLWPGLVRTQNILENIGPLKDTLGKYFELAETPTYVGRTVVAFLSKPHAEVMLKSGHVVITTDVGREHGITDENGLTPPALLQLNLILTASGYHRLAYFIPDFIRIPLCIARMAEAYQHS